LLGGGRCRSPAAHARRGVRVPGPRALATPDGARTGRARGPSRGRGTCGGPCAVGFGPAGKPGRPAAGRALGWRAAAPRDRPGPRREARPAPPRRAVLLGRPAVTAVPSPAPARAVARDSRTDHLRDPRLRRRGGPRRARPL